MFGKIGQEERMKRRISLTVNGKKEELEVEPRLLLVHLIREKSRPDGHACWLRYNAMRSVYR